LPAVDPEIGRPSVKYYVEGLSWGADLDGPYKSVVWISRHETDRGCLRLTLHHYQRLSVRLFEPQVMRVVLDSAATALYRELLEVLVALAFCAL